VLYQTNPGQNTLVVDEEIVFMYNAGNRITTYNREEYRVNSLQEKGGHRLKATLSKNSGMSPDWSAEEICDQRVERHG
jgi:hypothetical protein